MPQNTKKSRNGRRFLDAGAALIFVGAALAFGSCTGASGDPKLTATPARTVTQPPPTATPQPSPASPAPQLSPTAAHTLPAPGAASAPIPTRVPAPFGTSVTISVVGDVSLARELVPRMEVNGAYYPYALIQPLLDGDIVVGNLEGALTDRGEPWPKGYNFRTPPRFTSGLAEAGFDLVSLANNHAMDYGAIGLTDTLDALDAAGVRYSGGGRGALQAATPTVIEANGLRVAFIGCALTPDESGGFSIHAWSAGPETPGLFICAADTLATWVEQARSFADFVVVVVHAGSEYVNTPNATQRDIAQWALDAGADAYIGHHAHVVQPVELRNGRLVAWGLGNFIFDLDDVDLANIPEPRVSLVLRFTLTIGAGVTWFDALPVVLDNAQDRPRPATADEAAVLQDLISP